MEQNKLQTLVTTPSSSLQVSVATLAPAKIRHSPSVRYGAAPTRLMTHIAMQLADGSGSPVTWGKHVTDEQYGTAPR